MRPLPGLRDVHRWGVQRLRIELFDGLLRREHLHLDRPQRLRRPRPGLRAVRPERRRLQPDWRVHVWQQPGLRCRPTLFRRGLCL